MLRVETRTATIEVQARQAALAPEGQWVRYNTPAAEGAEGGLASKPRCMD